MSSSSFPPNLLEDFAHTLSELFPHDVQKLKVIESSKKKGGGLDFHAYAKDPFGLAAVLWPKAVFADYQRDIVQSVIDNYDTIVVAGNELGKDYIAGFIVVWFFLTRTPCRVVTTSADGPQLEAVLWGEMRRFIQSSVIPLDYTDGGPLIINHLHLRKVSFTDLDARSGEPMMCPLSFVMARVAAKGEGMLGHHLAELELPDGTILPNTLGVGDEASAVDDESWEAMETWAHRRLAIGNPWPTTNFFKRYVKEGDITVSDSDHEHDDVMDDIDNIPDE